MSGMNEPAKSLDLLNIQYSVFLGAILSLSFVTQVSSSGNSRVSILPVVDLVGRPESVLLAAYFILDWFTANTKKVRSFGSPLLLFIRLAWVAMLGATVVAMNGEGYWKFALLSAYLIATGVYDLWFMKRLASEKGDGDSVVGVLLAALRLTSAIVIFFPVVFCYFGRSDVLDAWDDPKSPRDYLFYFVVFYLSLKVIRFRYLAKYPSTSGG